MHAILVPVDGSVHAGKAIRIACDLAEKYGGRIALFHSIAKDRRPEELKGLPVAKDFSPNIVAALDKAGTVTTGKAEIGEQLVPVSVLHAIGAKILADAAAKVRRRDLEYEVLEIAGGDTAEDILIAARQVKANTIVMGCRGLSDDQSAMFGSVSHTVFARADCTCISVK